MSEECKGAGRDPLLRLVSVSLVYSRWGIAVCGQGAGCTAAAAHGPAVESTRCVWDMLRTVDDWCVVGRVSACCVILARVMHRA